MLDSKEILMLQSNSFKIKHFNCNKKGKRVAHFRIEQQIGKGGFATVYKAVQIHTGVKVAVKVVDLDSISSKDLLNLKRQIRIHEKLRHPHIVRIYETIWTQNRVYIFMELVKGKELFEYLKQYGPMDQKRAAKIFYQIVKAVQYLHHLGVTHRDIKTQNILIDSHFNAKLIDFGLSKTFNSIQDDCQTTFCGSPSYTAPEILEKKKYSGQRVDIWCLGVTLYVLLQACLPFDDFDRKYRERNIHNLNWHKSQDSSSQAIQLYEAIFAKERNRITIDDILASNFFVKQRGFIQQIFEREEDLFEELNIKAIKKVCLILNVEDEIAKKEIKTKKNGQIYCVYLLCLQNKSLFQESKQETNKNLCRKSEPHRSQNILIEPKTENMIRKKRSESPVVKIFPKINNSIRAKTKQAKEFPAKNSYLLCPQKLKMDLFENDQLVKSTLRLKGREHKTIFSPQLDLDLSRPRLREDSPQSPKRLLDCVRRYN